MRHSSLGHLLTGESQRSQICECGGYRPAGDVLFLLLCEFARKKENPSLERYIEPPYAFSLCTELSVGTPCQRSQASRLNHLLFEVTAIATPQVAYSFVSNRCPALHTFNRAGRGAGTRRETKSQLSRCSYLSENASIREERFRNLFYPCVAWDS